MSENNQPSNNRILITGASGFIGSRLRSRLLEGGGEIHALSRNKQDQEGIHWWQGDLTDLETARFLMKEIRPNLIFHLASFVSGSRELRYVEPAFKNNLMSQVNLMIGASEVGCDRILFAGSLEEPDGGNSGAFPSSPYAASKWAGSMYARMFHELYRLPVVNLRIFMVYGPGQKDLTKLIPYVIMSLLRGDAPRLSSGRREIDWIFVDDVVDGLITVSQAPGLDGCTIELGSGSLVTIREVVHKLVDLVNPDIKPIFGALLDRPFEQIRVADIENTYEKTGWKPKTPLDRGLIQTVAWYKEQINL